MEQTVIIAHLVSTIFMTGVIWIIQLVHYPSFRFVDRRNLKAFHKHHTSGITPVVAPIMIIELASIIYLTVRGTEYSVILLIFTLLLWISTFGYQVPLHNRLASDWSDDVVEKLIKSNWIRTILWTGKSVVLVFWIVDNFT